MEAPSSDGLLATVNQLAKRLSPRARVFGTSNKAAFHLYGDALIAPDRAAMLHSMEAATQADPGFAEAYAAWARILLSEGNRVQADQVIHAAESSRQDDIERAKLVI